MELSTVSGSKHSRGDRGRHTHQLLLSARPPSLSAVLDYLCHDSLPRAEITEECPQPRAHACKLRRVVLTNGAAQKSLPGGRSAAGLLASTQAPPGTSWQMQAGDGGNGPAPHSRLLSLTPSLAAWYPGCSLTQEPQEGRDRGWVHSIYVIGPPLA